MWIDDTVADLELDVREWFGLEILQVLFRLLCDGVLLCPAGRVSLPTAVCD